MALLLIDCVVRLFGGLSVVYCLFCLGVGALTEYLLIVCMVFVIVLLWWFLFILVFLVCFVRLFSLYVLIVVMMFDVGFSLGLVLVFVCFCLLGLVGLSCGLWFVCLFVIWYCLSLLMVWFGCCRFVDLIVLLVGLVRCGVWWFVGLVYCVWNFVASLFG